MNNAGKNMRGCVTAEVNSGDGFLFFRLRCTTTIPHIRLFALLSQLDRGVGPYKTDCPRIWKTGTILEGIFSRLHCLIHHSKTTLDPRNSVCSLICRVSEGKLVCNACCDT